MYTLIIFLALVPVPVDTFPTKSDCTAAALKVTNFLIKTKTPGTVWCELMEEDQRT